MSDHQPPLQTTCPERAAGILDALDLAIEAHGGQLDRQGRLYIHHPIRVMAMVYPLGETARIVGVLHDVVEDTDVTLDELAEQYSSEVVDAIDAITKRDGEAYNDYLQRVRANRLATIVKIADIQHNLSPERRYPGDEANRAKYERALAALAGVASDREVRVPAAKITEGGA